MGAGDREAKKSRQVLREQAAAIDAIQLPELQQLFLDQLSSAGTLSPELEQALALGPSAMEGVSVDPRLKSQQMKALEQLAGVAETGMTPADQAAFELARRNAAQENQAMQGQILQQMQARGQGGSGAELIARLKGSQSAADRLQEAQLEQAKAQQAARMQAMNQVGNLSSQIRQQEFSEQSDIAKARDLVNQFNLQNQTAAQRANVQAKNLAQQQNLQNQQNIMNQNVALRNQQQQFNKGLAQQNFANALQKQAAKSGVTGQISNSYAQSAARAGGLEGQLIGAGLGMAATALAGPAGGAATQAIAPTAMNFDPTKFSNQA